MTFVLILVVGLLKLSCLVCMAFVAAAVAMWIQDCRRHRHCSHVRAKRVATLTVIDDPGSPEEVIVSDPDCGVEICRAKHCTRALIGDELFCGFCADRLPLKLRELLASTRRANNRESLERLVRLARDMLIERTAGAMTYQHRNGVDPALLKRRGRKPS